MAEQLPITKHPESRHARQWFVFHGLNSLLWLHFQDSRIWNNTFDLWPKFKMATRPDEAKVWRDPVLSLSSARPCGREWHKLPTKIFNFCSIKNNREHNRKRRSGKWKIVTIFLCSLSSSLYQTIFQISSIDCVLINSQ